MATSYLSAKFATLNLPESLSESLESLLNSLFQGVTSNLESRSLIMSPKRRNFIPKRQKSGSLPPEKAKISKPSREEVIKVHLQKVQETKEFTKKFNEDRLQREKRLHEKEEYERLKLIQELEDANRLKEELKKKTEEEKLKRLQDIQQKSEIRKQRMEEIKEQITVKKHSQKPLFKQMEEQYRQQVLMPTLEQHKAELAKKRMIYQPINAEELKEHSKKYDELMREFEHKRKREAEQKILEENVNKLSINLHSKFTSAVIEEERLKKEEIERSKHEAYSNYTKKKQYAQLVKEMFPPVVSEQKKLVIEADRRSLRDIRASKSGDHHRDTVTSQKPNKIFELKSDFGEFRKINASNNVKIKKKKKIVEATENVEKKEPKLIDYLAQKRKEREEKGVEVVSMRVDIEKEINDAENNIDRAKKIKEITEKVEREARKQERAIANAKGTGFKELEAGDQVNDMILSSIKAKLALLEKFNGK